MEKEARPHQALCVQVPDTEEWSIADTDTRAQEASPARAHGPLWGGGRQQGSAAKAPSARTPRGRAVQFQQPEATHLLQSGESGTLEHAFSVEASPSQFDAPHSANTQRPQLQCMSESTTDAPAEHTRLVPAAVCCENTTDVPDGAKQNSRDPCCGGGDGAPLQTHAGSAELWLCGSSQGHPKHEGSRMLEWFQLSALSSVARKVSGDRHLQLLSLWWVAVSGPVMVFTESYCSNLFAGAWCWVSLQFFRMCNMCAAGDHSILLHSVL